MLVQIRIWNGCVGAAGSLIRLQEHAVESLLCSDRLQSNTRYAGFWQAQLPEEDADRADYLIFTRAPK